jgi:hypothetical protein
MLIEQTLDARNLFFVSLTPSNMHPKSEHADARYEQKYLGTCVYCIKTFMLLA